MTDFDEVVAQEDRIIHVEDFFYDNPNKEYEPLPPHDLDSSPCFPIIYKEEITGLDSNDNKVSTTLYHCKMHPEISSIYLEMVEQHCKHGRVGCKNNNRNELCHYGPEEHEAEILKNFEHRLEG